MKKIMLIDVALALAMMPITAQAAISRPGETEVEELEIRLSNELGMQLQVGSWQGDWRRLWITFDKRPVVAIEQNLDGSFWQENRPIKVTDALNLAREAAPIGVSRFGLNRSNIGFRLVGVRPGDTATIRQYALAGKTVKITHTAAANGWNWIPREPRATRVVIQIRRWGVLVLSKNIHF